MPTTRQRRFEATLRWTALVAGWASAALILIFFVAEALAGGAEGDGLPTAWVDWLGVGLVGFGLLGFVLAWWRPAEGGIVAILGMALPTTLSVVRYGNLPWGLLVVAVVGILHVADGLLRSRGIGPPLVRLRPRNPGEV